MAISEAIYSEKSVEWETPKRLFDVLDTEFHFDLDAAANKKNTKCKRFYSASDNALTREWDANAVWLNPPYGDDIGQFMAKAREEVRQSHAGVVVCLVHARTDTAWWWNHVMNQLEVNVELRFIKGRVKFGGVSTSGSPFPSVLVIYRHVTDTMIGEEKSIQVTPHKRHIVSHGYLL